MTTTTIARKRNESKVRDMSEPDAENGRSLPRTSPKRPQKEKLWRDAGKLANEVLAHQGLEELRAKQKAENEEADKQQEEEMNAEYLAEGEIVVLQTPEWDKPKTCRVLKDTLPGELITVLCHYETEPRKVSPRYLLSIEPSSTEPPSTEASSTEPPSSEAQAMDPVVIEDAVPEIEPEIETEIEPEIEPEIEAEPLTEAEPQSDVSMPIIKEREQLLGLVDDTLPGWRRPWQGLFWRGRSGNEPVSPVFGNELHTFGTDCHEFWQNYDLLIVPSTIIGEVGYIVCGRSGCALAQGLYRGEAIDWAIESASNGNLSRWIKESVEKHGLTPRYEESKPSRVIGSSHPQVNYQFSGLVPQYQGAYQLELCEKSKVNFSRKEDATGDALLIQDSEDGLWRCGFMASIKKVNSANYKLSRMTKLPRPETEGFRQRLSALLKGKSEAHAWAKDVHDQIAKAQLLSKAEAKTEAKTEVNNEAIVKTEAIAQAVPAEVKKKKTSTKKAKDSPEPPPIVEQPISEQEIPEQAIPDVEAVTEDYDIEDTLEESSEESSVETEMELQVDPVDPFADDFQDPFADD
jgi:hypothetical protein